MLLIIEENNIFKDYEIIITQTTYFQLEHSIPRLSSFLNFYLFPGVCEYINPIGYICYNLKYYP